MGWCCRLTREETVKIIRIMVDSYPNYKPNDISETVDVWQMMLEEYSYQQISQALKEYILTEKTGFAPSIGQLANLVKEQKVRKYFEELEQMLLADTYRKMKIEKGDSKSLEMKHEGVPMPERYKERLEDIRNE